MSNKIFKKMFIARLFFNLKSISHMGQHYNGLFVREEKPETYFIITGATAKPGLVKGSVYC